MDNPENAPNIIDNSPGKELVMVIKDQIKKSKEAKFAIGYFFLSGFSLVKDDFPDSYENLPFLKIVMGNETTYPTKAELVEGYNLREEFKRRMIEDLQRLEPDEEHITKLRTLKEFIANNVIDVKLFDKSRLHAKLYLFITNPDEKFSSPGLAVVGSSNFTAEGLTKNKELNVLLTERGDVLYLNQWFDNLWDEAIEFREDLLKVIEYSGVLPESKYPKIGTFVDPQTLFKYLVYRWFEGRVLNLLKRDVLMEFQIVGVMNAISFINQFNGVILADSVGLGKSFMAAAIIQEFLNGQHPHWMSKEKKYPAVMLILPPSIISQWEDLLVGRPDDKTLKKMEAGEKVKINSEYFFKNHIKRMVKGDYNHKIYEIYDVSGEKLLGRIAFLSLGLFQNYKADLKNGVIDERLKKIADEYDLFIIDEAHKYRNKNTNRWRAARALQKKSNNFPNKFMLLTATPLNNTIDDLYNLIRIFTDDSFITFKIRNIEIDELIRQYKKFKREYEEKKDDGIKKELEKVATDIKRKVLDVIMLQRTRKYIAEEFKDLKINGRKLIFKDPKPYGIDYSPFYTNRFRDLIKQISKNINNIKFEHTKLYGVRYIVFEEDEEEGSYRVIEISELFRLLLGKRLESGIFPFETTLRKIYKKEKIFYVLFKKDVDTIMSKDDLKELIIKAMNEANIKKDIDEVSQEFMAETQEEDWFDRVISLLNEYVEKYNIQTQNDIEKIKIGLNIVLSNIEQDLKLMDEIFDAINRLKVRENGDFKVLGVVPKSEGDTESEIFCYEDDPKFEVLKQLITKPKYKSDKLSNIPTLNGKKFIIFTQYKDTAYYLYHNLKAWIEREVDLYPWLKDKKTDRIKIALVTGETDTTTKINIIKRFAPKANSGEDEVRKHGEIDILISTDALSEGVNLQDADAVVNFDLPWNPMIIVQRVGRVNRIGNEKDVYVLNYTPSGEIEILVGILNRLKQKIEDITLVVGKESRILSPEEEISVETFGERIKKISELSMTELEEMFGISEEFRELVKEGIKQEQIDEYKLLNIIQYVLDIKKEDFEEVAEKMGNGPYYTYVKSKSGRVYSMYEFYRGDTIVDKKIISIGEEGLRFESPLSLLELVENEGMSPVKIDIAIENLNKIEKVAKKKEEELRKGYKPKQKGFLNELCNKLIVEKKNAEDIENYSSVLNILSLLDYRQYSREIKSLLTEENLIEVDRYNKVTIKDFRGVVNTLHNYFLSRGIGDIKSLRLRRVNVGWFYAYNS